MDIQSLKAKVCKARRSCRIREQLDRALTNIFSFVLCIDLVQKSRLLCRNIGE